MQSIYIPLSRHSIYLTRRHFITITAKNKNSFQLLSLSRLHHRQLNEQALREKEEIFENRDQRLDKRFNTGVIKGLYNMNQEEIFYTYFYCDI